MDPLPACHHRGVMKRLPHRDDRTAPSDTATPSGPSRRAWARAAVAGLVLPAGLSACGVHRESEAHPGRQASADETVLQLVQSGARYAMATSRAHGAVPHAQRPATYISTRWVTDGLVEQVRHLKEKNGAVAIDEKKVLKPEVNRDVARALLASADAILPRLHEATDDLPLASDMVAWWIGAAHVVNPVGPLVSLPNDCAPVAASALGSLHEVTWAMQVLTTRLGPDARKPGVRRLGQLQDARRVVQNLAGRAGPSQEIGYALPREVMDRKERGDRFRAVLDPWVAELRTQVADRGDDPKAVHLYTALLGIATGLQMDWNEHSTPSVPQD